MEQTALATVKSAEVETFMFITADMQTGKIISTSAVMTEGEVRTLLREQGMSNTEIEDKIAHARKNST